MPVEVIFYFLYLIEPKEEYIGKFSKFSEIILKETDSFNKLYGEKDEFSKKNCNNPEEWCILSGKIDGSEAKIKYYKERIILTINTNFDDKDIHILFKQAKIKRDTLLENDLVCLDGIQNKLCSLCKDSIQSVYLYPLIEIDKLYTPKDQEEFFSNDEAITTFYYEIPDVGNMHYALPFFPSKYEKVLMRVSGPSIITTKICNIMRAKLINLIYESALYRMRECEKKNRNSPLCKQVLGDDYEYLRNYIAQTFFSVESEASQIEMTSSLQILSYISAFGALAGIIAISYAMLYILPLPLEQLKTIAAIILFILTICMLLVVTKNKIFNRTSDYLETVFNDLIKKDTSEKK
jgi:hypothetical protein